MSTRVSKAAETVEPVTPDEVARALDSVLKSKQFVNAHKRQKFLRLICDFYLAGRANELNEYAIAYDVFGRDSGYNPASDPIVRVAAHEIRKKLEVYYAGEGAGDPIRLDIPAGSYQPVFSKAALPAAEESPRAIAPPQPRGRLRSPAVLGTVAAILAVVVVVLAISNFNLRREAAEARTPREAATYGAAWEPFLKEGSPPLVVLSNPPVLRLSNPSDPDALDSRSIALSPDEIEMLKGKAVMNPEIVIKEPDASTGEVSEGDKVVAKPHRDPRLILSDNFYTGMGEAIGLSRITDLFRTVNRTFLLKQSRTVNADDLKSRNVILLGGVWVNEWSAKLPKNEDFLFTNNATVENRNPQPGESREYIPQFDGRTGALLVDYALITVKQNLSDESRVMVLAGVYSQGTEAAGEYVTNHWYLTQLNQRLRELADSGENPRHFQALLKVEVENGIPTRVSLVAFHVLRN
jgi:hypothetical protein